MTDAHDDDRDEKKRDRSVCAEKDRQEDQNVSDTHVDGRDRYGIKRPQESQLAVHQTGSPGEAQRKDQNEDAEKKTHQKEGFHGVIGEKIRLSEDKGDQHPQERRIRRGREDDHQGGERGKEGIDDEDFRNRNDLGTVLNRGDRMPDILHDRMEELRNRRENGADFRDKSGESKAALPIGGGDFLVPYLLRLLLLPGFLSCGGSGAGRRFCIRRSRGGVMGRTVLRCRRRRGRGAGTIGIPGPVYAGTAGTALSRCQFSSTVKTRLHVKYSLLLP